MAIFPLRKRPKESYHESPRAFGSLRNNGLRKHAGCDLYTKAGDEVLAVEDGVLISDLYLFYDVVFAVEVKHPSGIFRYGEISKLAPGLKKGSEVKAGQVIAYVGKMVSVSQSMLHFEKYAGTATGNLTVLGDRPFARRSDLENPTSFLDSCVVLNNG
jgi:murein DD-endopeptidase MepM/ murein hydrolase activator NlpD